MSFLQFDDWLVRALCIAIKYEELIVCIILLLDNVVVFHDVFHRLFKIFIIGAPTRIIYLLNDLLGGIHLVVIE